jgi:DNA-binding MarR family transcriptional regulator
VADVTETIQEDPAWADTLAAELRVSLMKSARRLRAEKSEDELSAGQFSVLAMIDRYGPSTPRALADLERVQPPSMTRTLAALAEHGLIQRTTHPDDGRQILIQLTDSGTAAVRETRRRRNAWLADRLSELTDDERAVLASASQILRRIAAS